MPNNQLIVRVEKLKTLQNISGASDHNLRKKTVSNAIETLNNKYWGFAKPADAATALHQKLGITPRKNSVYGNEYLISVSPEFFIGKSRSEIESLFEDCIKFLKRKHGQGLLQAALHLDESTPHLHAIVTPVYKNTKGDWRLSAKHFFDNPRGNKVPEHQKKLSLLQTDLTEYLNAHGHKVSRGIKGSKAKHQKIQRYYSKLNDSLTVLDNQLSKLHTELCQFPPAPDLFNTRSCYQQLLSMTKKLTSYYSKANRLHIAERDKLQNRITGLINQLKANERDRLTLRSLFSAAGILYEKDPVELKELIRLGVEKRSEEQSKHRKYQFHTTQHIKEIRRLEPCLKKALNNKNNNKELLP